MYTVINDKGQAYERDAPKRLSSLPDYLVTGNLDTGTHMDGFRRGPGSEMADKTLAEPPLTQPAGNRSNRLLFSIVFYDFGGGGLGMSRVQAPPKTIVFPRV